MSTYNRREASLGKPAQEDDEMAKEYPDTADYRESAPTEDEGKE